MKLLDNIYSVEAIDLASSTVTIKLLADSTIYRAHFPEMPVTPGVCIIGIAVELATALSGTDLQLAEVVNAKFLSLIDPRRSPEIQYKFSFKNGLDTRPLNCSAVVADSSTTFAKLSLILD
ncbi:MAG: 3-hydroxyacyl-ACP dehydratase [Muribaculaceae bacterium]|nr:3-hydroxyacyl-ACP dehydratase [Muribaculaceae bacterium]